MTIWQVLSLLCQFSLFVQCEFSYCVALCQNLVCVLSMFANLFIIDDRYMFLTLDFKFQQFGLCMPLTLAKKWLFNYEFLTFIVRELIYLEKETKIILKVQCKSFEKRASIPNFIVNFSIQCLIFYISITFRNVLLWSASFIFYIKK